MKKAIQYIIDNYNVDGTIFLENTVHKFTHSTKFDSEWRFSVFINGEVRQYKAPTKYLALKLTLASLDALMLNKNHTGE